MKGGEWVCDIFVSVLNTEMVQKVEGDKMYCPKEANYGWRPVLSLSKHRAKMNKESKMCTHFWMN